MNKLRTASTYTGATAYWLESTGTWTNGSGSKSIFIDSRATVNLVNSASDQSYRTNLALTFEGAFSQRSPNTGTRGGWESPE
jgi:hypothetical protein